MPKTNKEINQEALKNAVREEMVEWFKNLPWWRRLFNKFEV